MKPGFMPIVGVLLMCFSFGSALGEEAKKLCPDPDLKYSVFSGEDYWNIFLDDSLSEVIQTEEYICARYSFQGEDAPYSYIIQVSMKEVGNRKIKERVFLKKIRHALDLYLFFEKEIKEKNVELWSQVMDAFLKRDNLLLRKITGLKYKSVDEWFEWWKINKDHLVLSEDGKYLIVKNRSMHAGRPDQTYPE